MLTRVQAMPQYAAQSYGGIDNEGNPTGVSLKTGKGEMSVPTDKMQILVIKNDKLIYESSNYNESDWWGY